MSYNRICKMYMHRLWFWLKEQTGDQSSRFEFARDNIYGAAILLGIGSATCIVIALSMIAQFVGEYTVSFYR